MTFSDLVIFSKKVFIFLLYIFLPIKIEKFFFSTTNLKWFVKFLISFEFFLIIRKEILDLFCISFCVIKDMLAESNSTLMIKEFFSKDVKSIILIQSEIFS